MIGLAAPLAGGDGQGAIRKSPARSAPQPGSAPSRRSIRWTSRRPIWPMCWPISVRYASARHSRKANAARPTSPFARHRRRRGARAASDRSLLDDCLAEGWTLGRLDATARAILRAGAYELMFRNDIPAKVAISQYIDVHTPFLTASRASSMRRSTNWPAVSGKARSAAEPLPFGAAWRKFQPRCLDDSFGIFRPNRPGLGDPVPEFVCSHCCPALD